MLETPFEEGFGVPGIGIVENIFDKADVVINQMSYTFVFFLRNRQLDRCFCIVSLEKVRPDYFFFVFLQVTYRNIEMIVGILGIRRPDKQHRFVDLVGIFQQLTEFQRIPVKYA